MRVGDRHHPDIIELQIPAGKVCRIPGGSRFNRRRHSLRSSSLGQHARGHVSVAFTCNSCNRWDGVAAHTQRSFLRRGSNRACLRPSVQGREPPGCAQRSRHTPDRRSGHRAARRAVPGQSRRTDHSRSCRWASDLRRPDVGSPWSNLFCVCRSCRRHPQPHPD